MILREEIVRSLLELGALSDAAFDLLLVSLHASNPSLSLEELASSIEKQLPKGENADIESILDNLFVFYSARERLTLDTDEVIEDITDGLAHSKVDEKTREKVINRVLRLFSEPGTMDLIAKAVGLIRDHHRIFVSSKTLTDMRPIFSHDDENPALIGTTVVHTLKIEYMEGQKVSQFYIALDSSDIVNLRRSLDRAEKKSAAITEFLDGTQLPYVEVR